jgi:hypothetical protein
MPVLFERSARKEQIASARSGAAEVRWQTPAAGQAVDFKVSYADPEQHYRTEDRARLFAYKADTFLLFVEVAALAQAGPDAWRSGNIRDIPADAAAKNALEAARQRGYQVVYLAAATGSPMVARRMRGWVEMSMLPDGPALGRLTDVDAAAAEAVWSKNLSPLKQRFRGSAAAVARDRSIVQALRATGIITFVVGEAEAPPGAIRLASWNELVAQLPK